jgi:adenosylhomocysteine nucleosidase
MRLGIVIALDAEARTLTRRDGRFLSHDSYQVLVSGPGPTRAEAAARALLAAGCDALLSFGLAGGLAPHLRPGALVLGERVLSAQGETLECSPALRERIATRLASNRPHAAPLYGADQPLVGHADKRALYEQFGAVAVDMESAAIARVAAAHACPCAVVRCVVDPCDFTLPRAALLGMAEDGGNRPLATARAVLRHPGELPALLRLALWYGGALRTLRGAGALLCE